MTGAQTEAAGFASALTEIEYRAWYLEQEIRDGRLTPAADLLDELAGIRAAVERERGLQTHIADRLEAIGEPLEEAIRRAREWTSGYDRRHAARRGDHLRLVRAADEGGETDA